MRIKLTLERPDSTTVNIAVTADATTTVQNVAEAIYGGDPTRDTITVPDRLTLQVASRDRGAGGAVRVLSPMADLIEAGLRSGSTVSIVQATASPGAAGQDRGAPVAVLRILRGPDAGREFPLAVGVSTIGRGHDVDVPLRDPLVSKRHARITVGETVEITDLNSANGLLMGGQRMSRSTLTSSDIVTIGASVVSLVVLQRVGGLAPTSPVVEFNRSPRVVARLVEHRVAAPVPPRVSDRRPFPYLSLVAPIIMGPLLFVTTHRALTLVVMLMSPLLLAGNWFDASIRRRRRWRDESRQFDLGEAVAYEAIAKAHGAEREVRLAETPAVTDAIDLVRRLGHLLWTHRPEHREFLSLRIGIGAGVSHAVFEMPATTTTAPPYWDRLERLAAACARIEGVPVVASLRTCGAVGVAGDAASAEGVARSMLIQLAAMHSPAELVITALVSQRDRAAWGWLEWLPHSGSPHSPLGDADHLADNAATGAVLLSRLEELLEARGAGLDEGAAPRGVLTEAEEKQVPPPVVPAVVVLISDNAPLDRARLTRLAERGPDAGVYAVWVAPALERLPAACRTFVLAQPELTTGEVRAGRLTFPVRCESTDLATAGEVARILAPVVDLGAPVADESDLPRSLSYVTLAGSAVENPDAVVERWKENRSLTPRDGSPRVRREAAATLRALVGHSATGPMYLDLRTQGPHALVGGTTGAGKSEFLQSWVLGMAAEHSPDRVTFLFVDYKGGAAFADCVRLPHTVGIVTDLSQHLVRRALTSLRAELRYRERLLNAKKAKDLVALERTGDPDCPPSLLIVVDEFAALAAEIPEFVDGVVDVAQRGRSLGLHLILATQRPAGVIKESLRANTNLRIALRMNDEADSSDILGVPLAAHVDPSIPGRGAVRTGPGRITAFQAAYAGGWTTGEPEQPRIGIEEMSFGTGAEWHVPAPEAGSTDDPGPTDIARIVTAVSAAAVRAGVPAPRRPWIEELAPTYDLALLPNPRTDVRLLLGVQDDPRAQSQPTVFYEPDRDGNMAIYGTGGSGKSAALRTVAVSAAITARGGPVQVYALDSASGLRMLEDLPHVGAVISTDDSERVTRLVRMLRGVVEERSARYAAVRAGSIVEYRRLANAPAEPRILVLVDGIGPFRDEYEYKQTPWFPVWAAFCQVAADGRQVGVHVVVAGDRALAVPRSLASTIQRRIVLRLASDDDYVMLGVPKDVLSSVSPPGRGILGDSEVQFAVLGGDANVAVQSRELGKLERAMRRIGIPHAPPIERLSDRFQLSTLPPRSGDLPAIGLDDLDIAPVGLPIRGTFLLGGPGGGGRTTALVMFAQAMHRAQSRRVVHLAPRRTSISRLDVWDTSAVGTEEVVALLGELSVALSDGTIPPASLLVCAESVTEFTGTPAEVPLNAFVRECVHTEQLIVGEAESSTWTKAFSIFQPFRAGRSGLVLTPGDLDGDSLLGTGFGRIARVDFPPGRGFLVVNGRARKVHLALPD